VRSAKPRDLLRRRGIVVWDSKIKMDPSLRWDDER